MAAAGPILIAGGGIGGLALALALAKIGRGAIVLEQRAALAAEGAGIQIGPNGVRVLQQLGVADALRPLVGEPDALSIRDGASARRITSLPLGTWIAARHGAPYWVAHRIDLHRALFEAAERAPRVSLRCNFAVSSIHRQGDGVRAASRDGEEVTGAALVGADGLWSVVRNEVCPSHALRFAGATATRTVIPVASAGRLSEPVVGLWLTPGVHVVHYPVRGGTEIAVVVIARESWQGTDWEALADRHQLMAHLARFHPSLVDVLSGSVQWRKWALYRLPELPHWSSDRITLIGDAAHPMLPYLAQGGVLALEDAAVLARCLAANAGDEARAFLTFEGLRRRRAARVQAASLRNGRIYHLPPPLAWARNGVLRLAPGAALMAHFDWLYGWRDSAS
jgi:salicylate hydroxylase